MLPQTLNIYAVTCRKIQRALKRDAKGHHISLLSISCTLCMLFSIRHINLAKCNFVHQGDRIIYVM